MNAPAALYSSESQTKTYTKRQIGHCKRCGFTATQTVTITRRTTMTYGITGMKTHNAYRYEGDNAIPCKCAGTEHFQRLLNMKFVDGTKRDDVPCDARCTGATGHKCICSCGGKNHGGAH